MRPLLPSTCISLAVVLLLAAGSASALTICISPCGPIAEPTPTTPVDPLDLPDLSTIGISGLVLTAGDAGGPYNVTGDLVIHAASGTLMADSIDLRAAGSIIFNPLPSLSLVAVFLSLCTIGCDPFVTEIPQFGADPFQLSILGPLTGALEVFASGDILITAEPIPEPSTALLLGLGLSLLVTARPDSKPSSRSAAGRPEWLAGRRRTRVEPRVNLARGQGAEPPL
jgi:hypothetical protein